MAATSPVTSTTIHPAVTKGLPKTLFGGGLAGGLGVTAPLPGDDCMAPLLGAGVIEALVLAGVTAPLVGVSPSHLPYLAPYSSEKSCLYEVWYDIRQWDETIRVWGYELT